MASERTEELYRLLAERGYPEELCAEIAYKHMNTDYTATRMISLQNIKSANRRPDR